MDAAEKRVGALMKVTPLISRLTAVKERRAVALVNSDEVCACACACWTLLLCMLDAVVVHVWHYACACWALLLCLLCACVPV